MDLSTSKLNDWKLYEIVRISNPRVQSLLKEKALQPNWFETRLLSIAEFFIISKIDVNALIGGFIESKKYIFFSSEFHSLLQVFEE